jgi:hypothetical protein
MGVSLNYIIVYVVSFIGMCVLIKNSSNTVYNLVALLPFWRSGYLNVAGLLLLANTLKQIFKNKPIILSRLI